MPSLFHDLAQAGWSALHPGVQSHAMQAYKTVAGHPVVTEAIAGLKNISLPALSKTAEQLNSALSTYEAWEVALLFMGLGVLFAFLGTSLNGLFARLLSLKLSHIFEAIRSVPLVRNYLQKEKAKMRQQILDGRPAQLAQRLTELPAKGKLPKELLEEMTARAAGDVQIEDAQSRLSGAVYFVSQAHKQLLDEVYAANSFRSGLNPSFLHATPWIM